MEADDEIDFGVGARLLSKIGDHLENGDTIGYVYSQDRENGRKIAAELKAHYSISSTKVERESVVLEFWSNYTV